MRRKKNYYIRKSHRYLGLLLGVQFLFWTAGGLYFSWNDIDEVHGDHLRKEKSFLPGSVQLVSPQLVLEQLQASSAVDSLQALQLIEVEGKPVYQIRYFSGEKATHLAAEKQPHHEPANELKVQLANAATGALLPPLTKAAAVRIAQASVVAPAAVEKVEYLTEVGSHHEYREKPLPAWAVTFRQPDCTVYIAAELGTFQSIRHNQWRVFDFFWMLHTMDYEGRDNIGNLLLRVFSILGLLTVLSGFVLYFISSPTLRKAKR